MGFQVMPAFSVFHTPPDPTATYQVLASSGCTAMSAIRPDIRAGPMLRNSRAEKVDEVSRESFPSSFFSFFCPKATWQAIRKENRNNADKRVFFITGRFLIYIAIKMEMLKS